MALVELKRAKHSDAWRLDERIAPCVLDGDEKRTDSLEPLLEVKVAVQW